jgi:undecaprenyl-diphosphatase
LFFCYFFMFIELLLAIIQAATEFLPVSSSGHLALFSNLISEPNIFFFTVLHLASLFAVLIFTRKEIKQLFMFKRQDKKMWLYLIIATIPAVLVGLLFKQVIEQAFSSYFFLGGAFIFTGFVLLLTKIKWIKGKLNAKNSLFIGLFQMLALFPGVSRSGMTVSSGLFSGIDREKAVKFSFLLFVPLALGAVVLEFGQAYFNFSLLFAFILCFVLSLVFLNLLMKIVKKGYFWIFAFYCWFIGIVSLLIGLFG